MSFMWPCRGKCGVEFSDTEYSFAKKYCTECLKRITNEKKKNTYQSIKEKGICRVCNGAITGRIRIYCSIECKKKWVYEKARQVRLRGQLQLHLAKVREIRRQIK